jgi:D-glycero-D-manno-heptose 1,7-bisphosphate phosphatase
MNKAIFLDRDGVINSDAGHYYVYRANDFVLTPGLGEALKRLQNNGYLLIIITNQSGVAKGEYATTDVDMLYESLQRLLEPHGVRFAEMYCCPHHDSAGKCLCRKPQPLMVQKAAARFNIDLAHSYFIGDSPRDMQCAEAAGVRGIKAATNEGIAAIVNKIPNLL